MADNTKGAFKSDKEKLKDITDSIEKGIKELFASDKYRQYLQTMSRFHRYSVNNQMLIFMQKPDASLVAGFNKWKDSFGRNVKRGEKGIKIIAPAPFKKKIEKEKLDPDTKLPMLDENGQPIKEVAEVSTSTFKVVSVFDVSQTEGKPLPELSSDLTGSVEHYDAFMEAVKRSSPVPIDFKPIENGADGFFSYDNQSITLREGMSETQTVCAAIHEMAHATLHNYSRRNKDETDVERKDRHTEEVEAESIAYAVCAYYGIETGENSFGYLASWSSDKELKELKASLETINKTSSELITAIDRNFKEVCKEQGIDLSAKADPITALATDLDRFAYDYDTYDYTDRVSDPQGNISDLVGEISSGNCSGVADWLRGIINDNTEYNQTAQSLLDRLTPYVKDEPIAEQQDTAEIPGIEENSMSDLPDPTITVKMMENYGYTDSNMLPLSKDRARELMDRDVTVYCLHTDNTEAMVVSESDIIDHYGIFGIEVTDWERIKADVPARDIEKRFNENPNNAILIYQIPNDDPKNLMFMRYDSLSEPPSRDDYEPVYTATIEPKETVSATLEAAYQKYNVDRPLDFTGHSLSVSDILAIKQNGEVSYHYCDSTGFRELPDFNKSNYLKNAEISTEDDYGMIDGILNNGDKKPTVAELEAQVKAGKSISLSDLANAVNDEKTERKPIAEKLKQKTPEQKRQRTAPKKKTERGI